MELGHDPDCSFLHSPHSSSAYMVTGLKSLGGTPVDIPLPILEWLSIKKILFL